MPAFDAIPEPDSQYTTVAALCRTYGLTAPTVASAEETEMLAAIEAATSALDEYLGWSLRPITGAKTVWTDSNQFLLLPAPLRSMSACEEVAFDGVVVRDLLEEIRPAPEQSLLIDGSNNRLVTALESTDYMPAMPNGLRITGMWGCQTYPAILQYAAAAVAHTIWRTLRHDETQETSTATVGLNTQFSIKDMGPNYSLIPTRYQMSLRGLRRPQL